jgi:hypothetical protein
MHTQLVLQKVIRVLKQYHHEYYLFDLGSPVQPNFSTTNSLVERTTTDALMGSFPENAGYDG